MHACAAAQLAFALGRFFGQDMAHERASAFDTAAGGNLEALLSTAFRLHLGHDCSFSNIAPGAPHREDFGNPDHYFYSATTFLRPQLRQVQQRPRSVLVLSWSLPPSAWPPFLAIAPSPS